MSRPVIFDLFYTLIRGADEERDRVVGEMAVMIGVPPATSGWPSRIRRSITLLLNAWALSRRNASLLATAQTVSWPGRQRSV
ncbi:hypothetical protein [Micromonospora sonchi]|uniref:hypothetical protein n=1 Tax=Micromonospora sonchi TaxID=1763543 RepID=UPI001E451B9E|nr:hypothetical protein [Micromonospora sonchi]